MLKKIFIVDGSTAIPRVEFIKHPNPVMVEEGRDASFCVRVRSSTGQKPVVSWKVGGETIIPCERYIVS